MYAVASHALFSGAASERLGGGLFKEVIVTNSIPVPPHKRFPQLTVLSVADLLGEAVKRMAAGLSVETVERTTGHVARPELAKKE